jgi:hypothetical protein
MIYDEDRHSCRGVRDPGPPLVCEFAYWWSVFADNTSHPLDCCLFLDIHTRASEGEIMSMIRSTVLLGAAVVGAGAIALLGAGAASADSGINLGPGSNDGVLNGGAGNTGVLNFGYGNKGILNLGNGGTGVANIGNGSTGILNIGNGSGGVVTVGDGRNGLLNIGY